MGAKVIILDWIARIPTACIVSRDLVMCWSVFSGAFFSQRHRLSKTLPVECKATQWIFCLENEDLSATDRLKALMARGDLKQHFYCKYLRHHSDSQPIACSHPRYDVKLAGTIYYIHPNLRLKLPFQVGKGSRPSLAEAAREQKGSGYFQTLVFYL